MTTKAAKKMKLSTNGLDLIKSFEGLRLKAYKCVQTEKYYTIGYGHYGKDVTADMTITKQQAEKLLRADTEKAVANVNKYVPRYPDMTQNQFDALVSFAYNVGSIQQLTASGTRTLETIGRKILLYNKSSGRVLPGLTRRREKEQELFCRRPLDKPKL